MTERVSLGVNENEAAQIMQDSFVTKEDVADYLKYNYFKRERAALSFIPYPSATLEANKRTHFLFPGIQISMIGLLRKIDRHWDNIFVLGDEWWCNSHFAKHGLVQPRWYLMEKDPSPASSNKSFEEVLRMAPAGARLPSVVEALYMALLRYMKFGEDVFFRATSVWCSGQTKRILWSVMKRPSTEGLSVGKIIFYHSKKFPEKKEIITVYVDVQGHVANLAFPKRGAIFTFV